LLEQEQNAFLAKGHLFRSNEYKWPEDALHNWSRIWEYPYSYQNIATYLSEQSLLTSKIADIGSGVTFFPFCIAKLGPSVICSDVDGVVARDMHRAVQVVEHAPGNVCFRMTDGVRLPFKEDELDVVYCISVLEHVDDPKVLAEEISRIVKPGGLFVLTIDLDLRGDQELSVSKYKQLLQVLDDRFELRAPHREIRHPGDILRSTVGPYPAKEAYFYLAVEGFCLIKR
jgi:SAM-dependent methyltransferase